jgi:hypothetical protein
MYDLDIADSRLGIGAHLPQRCSLYQDQRHRSVHAPSEWGWRLSESLLDYAQVSMFMPIWYMAWRSETSAPLAYSAF